MTFASSEDSDQPGHPPSLIRVFAVHMKKPLVLSYPFSAQRRLWSDRLICVFAGRTGHFVGFVMLRLNAAVYLVFSHSNGYSGNIQPNLYTPYTIGSPCGDCPSSCDSTYSALCGKKYFLNLSSHFIRLLKTRVLRQVWFLF